MHQHTRAPLRTALHRLSLRTAGAVVTGEVFEVAVSCADAQATEALKVEAQRHLFAAFAEAGIRGVDQGQVGVLVASLDPLVREAVARAVVLIPQAQLLTGAPFELALADSRIEHAEVAQPQVAAQAAQRQVTGGLGMALQGQVVGITITKSAAGHAGAIGEILQVVFPAQ